MQDSLTITIFKNKDTIVNTITRPTLIKYSIQQNAIWSIDKNPMTSRLYNKHEKKFNGQHETESTHDVFIHMSPSCSLFGDRPPPLQIGKQLSAMVLAELTKNLLCRCKIFDLIVMVSSVLTANYTVGMT